MRPTTSACPAGLVRPALAGVEAYEPGRPVDDVRRELGVESVIKLASNEGPFPPMPGAIAAIEAAAAGVRAYPDAGAWELRDAIAARTGLDASQVLPGAGVDGLIRLMCLALLDPGDELVMAWPSFLSWRIGARDAGRDRRLRAPGGRRRVRPRRPARAGHPRTKLAVVVSPNNPTGGAVSAAALTRLPRRAARPRAAGASTRPTSSTCPRAPTTPRAWSPRAGRWRCTRTFSKAFGLAGLRVGYLMGPAELVRDLGIARNVFDVSSVGPGGRGREPRRGRRPAARSG